MKIRYQTSDKRITFEFDSADNKSAFEDIAKIQEVFEQEKCGHCESANLKYSCRTVDGNNYYEVACRDCNYKLAFGQNKVGGALFPRRYKLDKKTKKNVGIGINGWHLYTKDAEEDDD